VSGSLARFRYFARCAAVTPPPARFGKPTSFPARGSGFYDFVAMIFAKAGKADMIDGLHIAGRPSCRLTI